MFGWFRKKEIRSEATEAYAMGWSAGDAIVADLDRFIHQRFSPAFDACLSVLRGQIGKCINSIDAPPITLARIQYDIFRENVDELKPKMLREITAAMRQWLELVQHQQIQDELMQLINGRISDFQALLTIKGNEAFIEMADRLKEADRSWRAAKPEMSAQFPLGT